MLSELIILVLTETSENGLNYFGKGERVQNFVGKGENTGSIATFSSFPPVFSESYFFIIVWVLCGVVVNYLTRNPGVLDLSHTGSSGFFVGVFLGKTTV